MAYRVELIGRRFGRLVVLKKAPSRNHFNYWECVCDCGGTKTARGGDLKNGKTKSCGCIQHEGNRIKHGYSKKKNTKGEYRVWLGLKGRCLRTTNPKYPDYGGRGIKVCDRWLGKTGFQNFLSDMGERPSPNHSIDRINNDGNYEPNNCRWATSSQQSKNKRNNFFCWNIMERSWFWKNGQEKQGLALILLNFI